jgi:ankyrin repeat protein
MILSPLDPSILRRAPKRSGMFWTVRSATSESNSRNQCYLVRMLGSAAALAALMLASGQHSTIPPPKVPETPVESLHFAVRTGNWKEVERLVNGGTPVDARDALGSTPLLDAAWAGNTDIAKFLIAHGADVNARHSEAGSTPLQYAVLTSQAGMARVLIKAGASVAGGYRDGQSLLHAAAARGSLPVIELLLEAKADIQALDANGNTPLDSAVLHGQPLAVETLLRHRADVKYVHPIDGRGALHEACMRGFSNMVQPLVEAGADPSARDRFGQTPLDIALAYKNGNVVGALLRLGQNLKESQRIAEETMESATLRGQTEIVRILVDNGFDINKPAADGSSYLNDAALKGQQKMVQMLLEHGASVAVRNQTGGTPLHDAALSGNANVVALLLDHGAAINEVERESGATPLMIAASMGRVEAVRLLLKRGANRQLRDKAGHNALERARNSENPEIVMLLRNPSVKSDGRKRN